MYLSPGLMRRDIIQCFAISLDKYPAMDNFLMWECNINVDVRQHSTDDSRLRRTVWHFAHIWQSTDVRLRADETNFNWRPKAVVCSQKPNVLLCCRTACYTLNIIGLPWDQFGFRQSVKTYDNKQDCSCVFTSDTRFCLHGRTSWAQLTLWLCFLFLGFRLRFCIDCDWLSNRC